MLQRLLNMISYVKVFSSFNDIARFRRVAYKNASDPVDLAVRAVGSNPMHVRPKTSDAAVLWDTFHEKFHLPDGDLPRDATIFDLGANVGFTAAHFAALYPMANIIAVELDKANCEAARANLKGFGNCTLVNAAVWSNDGEVSYDPNEEEWGFHVDNALSAKGSLVVDAKTMDTLMAEHDVKTIDYVKMDIEGAEWPVLSTGATWLDSVKMMKVELHPKFNQDATYDNCARILSARGFKCSRDKRHWNTLVATRYH